MLPMSDSHTLGKAIASYALDLGAVKFSFDKPFQWASGYFMPIYNDNRLLLSSALIRRTVVEALVALLKENKISPTCIGGVPTAGLPWATSLADALSLPLIYIRDKAKDHGLQKRIEGLVERNAEVVLVEDVISTGGSAASAIPAVREAGANCSVCLGIYSYDFPEAHNKFQEHNAKVLSALTYDTLLSVALERMYITGEQLESLKEWQNSPFNWGAKRGFHQAAK